MSITEVDSTLPLNSLLFELRRQPGLLTEFRSEPDVVMKRFGLSEEEATAFRQQDVATLRRLGVHPYFLPQISRFFEPGGWGYTGNDSETVRRFGAALGTGAGTAPKSKGDA